MQKLVAKQLRAFPRERLSYLLIVVRGRILYSLVEECQHFVLPTKRCMVFTVFVGPFEVAVETLLVKWEDRIYEIRVHSRGSDNTTFTIGTGWYIKADLIGDRFELLKILNVKRILFIISSKLFCSAWYPNVNFQHVN